MSGARRELCGGRPEPHWPSGLAGQGPFLLRSASASAQGRRGRRGSGRRWLRCRPCRPATSSARRRSIPSVPSRPLIPGKRFGHGRGGLIVHRGSPRRIVVGGALPMVGSTAGHYIGSPAAGGRDTPRRLLPGANRCQIWMPILTNIARDSRRNCASCCGSPASAPTVHLRTMSAGPPGPESPKLRKSQVAVVKPWALKIAG